MTALLNQRLATKLTLATFLLTFERRLGTQPYPADSGPSTVSDGNRLAKHTLKKKLQLFKAQLPKQARAKLPENTPTHRIRVKTN